MITITKISTKGADKRRTFLPRKVRRESKSKKVKRGTVSMIDPLVEKKRGG